MRRAAAGRRPPQAAIAPSATAAALGLSEIRFAICEQLDAGDAKSLLAAARVGRAWAADALPLLWRCASDVALAARPSYGGFNYAVWIRSLTIPLTLPCERTQRDWPSSLPRLQQLTPGGECIRAEANTISSGAPGGFEALLARCGSPSLPLRVTIEGLYWVIMYENSSEEDVVGGGFRRRERFPEQIFHLLARRRHLVDFTCGWPISANAISNAVAADDDFVPFSDLKSLDISVRATTTSVLLRGPGFQQSLATLRLSVAAGSVGVLPAAALIVQLQSLEVNFWDEDTLELTAAELLALRSLTQLRKVYICSQLANLTAYGFGDRELAQLVACWPHLREWEMIINWDVTPTAFVLFGQHCRQLRILELWDESTLCAFQDTKLDPSTLLFPELRELRFDGTVGLDPTGLSFEDRSLRAATLARLILLHVPNLEGIAICGVNPIETRIKQLISQHWHDKEAES